jgi:hypothetical protein
MENNLTSLASPDPKTFENAISLLAASVLTGQGEEKLQAMAAAVEALAQNPILAKRERDRRVRLILQAGKMDSGELVALSGRVDFRQLGFLNVLLALAAPEHRLLFLRRSPEGALRSAGESNFEASSEKDVPQVEALSADLYESVHGSVVLLGNEPEHARNSSLLRENRFTPLRRESLDGIEELLLSGACGLVIAASFWDGRVACDQALDLRKISSLTSMLFLRVDERLLHPEAGEVLTEMISGGGDNVYICNGIGCELTYSDLALLGRIARDLDASEKIVLASDEISESEGRVLKMGVLGSIKGQRSTPRVGRLGLTFIRGGQSGAKIVVVRPDDGGLPIVAKIDKVEKLRDELGRYDLYIRRWENRVHPKIHSHLGCSVLIYSLVDDSNSPERPAPTLEERLEKLLNSELGNWGEPPPLEESLVTAVERAGRMLAGLNRNRAEDHPKPYASWLSSGIREQARTGVNWLFEGSLANGGLISQAELWMTQVQKLDGLAKTHGDVHLRNIILNDDLLPCFVDFALAGPGHPCYDLVRLNAGILFRAFRMLDDESSISRLLCGVLEGRSYEQLGATYQPLLSSVANRLAIRAAVNIRQLCMEVLGQYGGGHQDYVAMQGLVACQALTMPYCQTGIVRALLRAASVN